MRRLLPVMTLLLVVGAAAWATHDVGWQALARHRSVLLAWVAVHPFEAAGMYLLAYVATAALSLPHGVLLTATGGLLFGPVAGSILTAIGATAGGTLLILLLRTVLGGVLARQQRRIPDTVRARLRRDGLSYLLFARFLPVVPFWMVNLAAAFTGLPLRVFIPGTLFGVLPVTFVVSTMGAGLGDVLAAGEAPDLTALLAPRIVLPLVALALLSLLPVLLRRRGSDAKGRHA